MKKKQLGSRAKLLTSPAFPWSGRLLFSELRGMLAREHRAPGTYADLAQIMGVGKTTAYRWFEEGVDQPNVIGLFACLERLPLSKRQDFVESHCRMFADFQHPWILHSPARVGKLMELLNKQRGLTIIAGGRDLARSFVFHALGNAYHRLHRNTRYKITGLDLCPPDRVIPLEFCTYVDGSGLEDLQQIILTLWPRIVTTSAQNVMLSGVWAFQNLRQDILRLADRLHVVLACAGTPEIRSIARQLHSPIHLITVFDLKRASQGIRLHLRQIRNAKPRRKEG